MNFSRHLQKTVFRAVQQAALEQNAEAFVIGGYVRDLMLKRLNKDIDIVTSGDGPALANRTAELLNVKRVSIFANFGTAHFIYKGSEVEFVSARKESYRLTSRKPDVEKGSLEDDQMRRDFTVNAMALSLQKESFGELVDPFNGLLDLENKILRTPLEPAITYSDDPLRMMRAIRFAAQLNFSIEEKSLQAIKENAARLEIVSVERTMVEFNKILLSKKPSVGLKLLFDTDLLHQFFPEMVKLHGVEKRNNYAHKDNFYHTLEVVDNLRANTNNLWLLWGAVLHDIAKPHTKRFEEGIGWTFHGHEDVGARWVPKIFQRLKLPLDHQMKFVQKLVALHLRPIALTKDEIDDLMLLCQADITSKNETKVKRYLSNYEKVKLKLVELEEKDRVRNFQPPVSGELVMETFNLQPCKEVGEIKNAIKDAILDGKIQNNFEEAFAHMIELGKALNLAPKN